MHLLAENVGWLVCLWFFIRSLDLAVSNLRARWAGGETTYSLIAGLAYAFLAVLFFIVLLTHL